MRYKVFTLAVLLTLVLTACSPSPTPPATSASATQAPPTIPPPTKAPVTQPPDVATLPPSAASGNTVEVKIADFAFDPATITIKVGTTVKWTNMDSAAHTVTADDNLWTSARLKQGETYTHTFDQAGTYPYHCSLHSNMQAIVIVQP